MAAEPEAAEATKAPFEAVGVVVEAELDPVVDAVLPADDEAPAEAAEPPVEPVPLMTTVARISLTKGNWVWRRLMKTARSKGVAGETVRVKRVLTSV